jgi:hypothetical protein
LIFPERAFDGLILKTETILSFPLPDMAKIVITILLLFLIILRRLSLITKWAYPKIAGIGNYFVQTNQALAAQIPAMA